MPEINSSTLNAESIIKEILVSDVYLETDIDRLDVDANLRDEYGLDSLGFLELRTRCENRFDVSIADDDFNPVNFNSIRILAVFVDNLQKSQRNAAL
ncbi:acyl carrier protein [Streptomyces sp. NPDC087908]|uniref:acyl carrier protein n=1 Tax=Streptomyces sp. NPDC087908 TaxID=3365820 RepID=UPI0037FF3D16